MAHCVPTSTTDFLFIPQVTVHYDQRDGAVIPKRVHTIVISVQHDDCISLEEQKKVLKEKVKPRKTLMNATFPDSDLINIFDFMLHRYYQVINTVVPAKYLDDKTIYHLQPSGRFVIGGPQVTVAQQLHLENKL